MQSVVLLLGSNLGDRVRFLESAQCLIAQRVGIITQQTEIIGTEAVGYQSEKAYLNQVLVVETTLEPLEVLDTVQQIERELGRTVQRTSRTDVITDRTIDIDLLYYIYSTPSIDYKVRQYTNSQDICMFACHAEGRGFEFRPDHKHERDCNMLGRGFEPQRGHKDAKYCNEHKRSATNSSIYVRKKTSKENPSPVDLFSENSLHLNTPRLILPHPEIQNRQFVIDLLAQITLQ